MLKASRVAVFGIGGVGGYVVEALARSGIGTLELFDSDKICVTNINRQIFAAYSTIGQYKVDAMEARIKDINPYCTVIKHQCFFLPENSAQFDFQEYSYVVDAVDTVSAKIEIIKKACAAGVPVISSMGAGNKINASALEISDIYNTKVCPLAKIMRKLCRDNSIESLKVVYSKETSLISKTDIIADDIDSEYCETASKKNRPLCGSTAFVPAVAGLLIAGEVVKDLTGIMGGRIEK